MERVVEGRGESTDTVIVNGQVVSKETGEVLEESRA
jgi:hypothetical protein